MNQNVKNMTLRCGRIIRIIESFEVKYLSDICHATSGLMFNGKNAK